MSRFRAAARVAAFFLMSLCGSPLVHGEDGGYRSDVPDSLAPHADLQFDRYPGMNITLDDSVVVGLRFEWEYGWKR